MDNTTRYVIGVLGIILIAFIAIYLLLSRNTGSDTSTPKTKGVTQLTEYARQDSSVTLVTQGRIVGEDQFRSIRITVTPELRTLDILSGYGDVIQSSQTFANTATAYQEFLAALDRAGFARNKQSTIASSDGVCPLGFRYLYTLTADGDKAVDTWSTSCTTAQGNFNGSAPLVRQLFQAQITDYSKLTTGVRL